MNHAILSITFISTAIIYAELWCYILNKPHQKLRSACGWGCGHLGSHKDAPPDDHIGERGASADLPADLADVPPDRGERCG